MRNYVTSCETCQRNKYEALKLVGLLQPLPIPTKVWEDITMDFIGELPKSNDYDTIMVVVDRLIKYNHFLPFKHPYTTCQVVALFVP